MFFGYKIFIENFLSKSSQQKQVIKFNNDFEAHMLIW